VVIKFYLNYGIKKVVKVNVIKIATMQAGGKKSFTYLLTLKNMNDKKEKHELKLSDVPMEPMYL
jgi:hypothetical protein